MSIAKLRAVLLLLATTILPVAPARAQSTAFTYQGAWTIQVLPRTACTISGFASMLMFKVIQSWPVLLQTACL